MARHLGAVTSSTERTKLSLCVAVLFLVAACGDGESITAEADCQDPPASDAEEAAELYVSAWNEEEPAQRACMLERSLSPDAALIAATAPTEGQAAVAQELSERIALLLDDGTPRELVGAVESRHDEARLAWSWSGPSDSVAGHGEDWLEFDEDGLVSRVHILAGTGADAPLSASLASWQQAWNTHDEAVRADELGQAVTEDVRFTDLVTDVRGREALGLEIERQQDAVDGELRLDDRVEVFASADGEPILVRVPAQIVFPQGGSIRVVDYVRLRDGRVERLSGFPSSPH